MKFRKKPVVVDAEQWEPGKRVEGVCNCAACFDVYGYYRTHVHTLEGVHVISPGDWIITGVKGEKYPCKPDIFEMTYEPAENEPKR
jgi:hypothetical protein